MSGSRWDIKVCVTHCVSGDSLSVSVAESPATTLCSDQDCFPDHVFVLNRLEPKLKGIFGRPSGGEGRLRICSDAAAAAAAAAASALPPAFLPAPRDELVDMYKAFAKDFPVISIEDPFDQDDIANCQKLTAEGVCQATLSPPFNTTRHCPPCDASATQGHLMIQCDALCPR